MTVKAAVRPGIAGRPKPPVGKPVVYTEYLSNDKKYEKLQEAYDAYAKLVTDGTYQQYKDTLPK